MMRELYLPLDGEMLFVRCSEIRPERRSLFFIHGLGESGLCFTEAFERLGSIECNIVVLDNVGCGRSSAAVNGGYSFDEQIARLKKAASLLGLGELILVGHSLGGILATCWAAEDRSGTVTGLVNIEGNLTPADAPFSRLAVDMHEALGSDSGAWCKWFRTEFMEKMILHNNGSEWESYRRYYASLWYCRPEAFLANAREICLKNKAIDGEAGTEIGRLYASITLPKIYCWGSESLSEEARDFLNRNGLADRAFPNARHWPMIDRPEEFYGFLAAFVT